MSNDKQLFTFGDKLEALHWHKEEHGIEYVTITGINKKTKVYYWEADLNWELGGKLHSGYYFHEAKAYKEKSLTDFINNQQDLNPEYQKIINDNFNDLIMSNSKQSSLELFAIALYEQGYLKGNGDEINTLLGEYKEMHKKEIEEAWDKGDYNIDLPDGTWEQKYKSAEQYYNETFNNK